MSHHPEARRPSRCSSSAPSRWVQTIPRSRSTRRSRPRGTCHRASASPLCCLISPSPSRLPGPRRRTGQETGPRRPAATALIVERMKVPFWVATDNLTLRRPPETYRGNISRPCPHRDEDEGARPRQRETRGYSATNSTIAPYLDPIRGMRRQQSSGGPTSLGRESDQSYLSTRSWVSE